MTISQIKAYPELFDNKNNVICFVVWKLIATNGDYSSQMQGTIDIPTEQFEPFIPYNELTEEKVLSWVFNIMGVEQVTEYEKACMEKLEELVIIR